MRLGLGLGLGFGGGNRAPHIALSTPSQAENTAIGTTIGTLSVVGATTGSSGWAFAKTVDEDSAFTLTTATVKNAIVFDYETADSHVAFYTATKAGDPASPITTPIRVGVTNVFEAANLSALALDDTSVPEDSAATINITGATASSTIASTALPPGMTLNSGARTWTGTPTTPGSYSGTFTETLADSANSPRDTPWSFTVTAVDDTLPAPVLDWTSADTVLDPSFSMTEIIEGDVVEVQIDDDSDFGSLFDSDTNTIDAGEAASGSLTFSGISTLSAGVTYNARARYQRGGIWSDWSNTETMTMVALPPTPVLTWTSDDTALDPTFHTTEVVEGDVAEIEIDDNIGFGSLYGTDTNTIDAGEAASGSLTFATPTLASGTTYYARVRYQRGGVWSDWSNTVSMTMASGSSFHLTLEDGSGSVLLENGSFLLLESASSTFHVTLEDGSGSLLLETGDFLLLESA